MTNPSRRGGAVPEVQPAPGSDSGASLVVAGLGRRFGARCVDTLLRFPLAYVLFAWTAVVYGGLIFSRTDPPDPAELIVPLVLGAVLVLYEPVVISRTGCTLGKLLFGISVRQRADPAKAPTHGQALARWAIPTVTGMALLWISWEALAALLTDDYGDRSGDVFSFIDGSRETPFAEDDLAWVLMNAVFYGVVAGLPFMSGVFGLIGRLRRGDGLGLHDRATGTVVVIRKSVPAATAESIRSRWDRFSRRLDAEITEQYRADASNPDMSAAELITEDDPFPWQDKS